jgi:RNA polymerase-binding transcription factor DksA
LTRFVFLAWEEVVQDKQTVLRSELEKVRTQVAELEKTLEEKPDYGLGKGNPAATRRQVDRALLRRLRQRAESLEQALSRLSQGAYGICVHCGRPINPERLAVLPDAKRCINCAQRIWLKRKRPDAAS